MDSQVAMQGKDTFRESPSDMMWPLSSQHTDSVPKADKETPASGLAPTPVITFYLAQSSSDDTKPQHRVTLPTFANAIWNFNNNTLQACNQEFCFYFGYAPTVLPGLTWRHLVMTDHAARGSDPKDVDLLEESNRRLSVIHNLLQTGKLQSCSARLYLLTSSSTLIFCHVNAVTIYDDHGSPSSVMWLVKKLPSADGSARAAAQLPPETNIGEALREASILSYEQSESKLVEIKRKKQPPTESRKPWDNNLAKFSLKRVKRPDDPNNAGAANSANKSAASSSNLPPKTISVVNPFSIAHLTPHLMNAHEHQLLDPSEYDYVAPHSPPPLPSSHHQYPPQNQLSRRMSDPTSQHIRKVMPLNQLSRHNSTEGFYSTPAPARQQSHQQQPQQQQQQSQHQHQQQQQQHQQQQQQLHQQRQQQVQLDHSYHHPTTQVIHHHMHPPPQHNASIPVNAPPAPHLSHYVASQQHQSQPIYMSDHPQHQHLVEYVHPSAHTQHPPMHHSPMVHHVPHHDAHSSSAMPPPMSSHSHQPSAHASTQVTHHHPQQHQSHAPHASSTYVQVVDCPACHSQSTSAPLHSHYYVTGVSDTNSNEQQIAASSSVQSVVADADGNKVVVETTSAAPPPNTIDPRSLLHQPPNAHPVSGPPNPEVFYEPQLPSSPRT